MRLFSASVLLSVLQLGGSVTAENRPLAERQLRARDYVNRDYYALHLSRDVRPQDVAKHLGLELEGPLGALPDHHLFSTPKSTRDVVADSIDQYRRRKKRDNNLDQLYNSILLAEKQRLKRLVKRELPPRDPEPKREPENIDTGGGASAKDVKAFQKSIMKQLDIADPIFADQWHLLNTKQIGKDINVTGVWTQGITGKNVTVSIVDDGLDMYSDDLKDNYFAEGSYDFNEGVAEPKPRLFDDKHGTRCAGEVAAVKNHVCGVGVAWDSRISGIRILSKQISDADEAIALNYAYEDNHIYSCSWGPPDDGIAMDAPGILIKRAMVNGIQNGRHGLGSVFVFASGNGASRDDNCNFDGYTNSIYSITVGAIDRKGLHPYYSESCSANLVVTYSSGSEDAIHTTDVGANACYKNHGGTSAAAPIAAGIFALVLSVRPDLTWRDMQYLSLLTALPVNEDDDDWVTTAIGRKFNHKYGYGSLDAYAIVEAAKTWELVKPQSWYHSPLLVVNSPIPQGNQGLVSHITLDADALKEANLEKIEHVTITINLEHDRRGEVSVDLISPNGLVSNLATTRQYDISRAGYDDWTFMTVKHWGEDGVGKWTIVVKDNVDNDFEGTLVDWKINLWGVAIDGTKSVLHPLPGDSMNRTHPLPIPYVSHPPVKTTTLESVSSTSPATEEPTVLISRPVKVKPSGAETAGIGGTAGGPSPTATATATSTAKPEANQDFNDRPYFIPSFLPTLGVSGKTQGWIYGSLVVIILFVGGIGIYMWIQKRKRKAKNLDYEFAVLEDDDDDFDTGLPGSSSQGAAAAGGRRHSRKKAKELYDAFGASDEETDDDDDLDSDSEKRGERGYKDERDYELEREEEARGIDEGSRIQGGDREALLGRAGRS